MLLFNRLLSPRAMTEFLEIQPQRDTRGGIDN